MRFPTRTAAAIFLAASFSLAHAQAPADTAPCASGKVPMFQPNKTLTSPVEMSFIQPNKKTITIYYSAPSVRCRQVFGGLVPFDQVWRTGANPATIIVSEVPLKIGTLDVPAGTHTIYTLPAAPGKPWLLIISNQVGQWGTVYAQDKDLGRTEMKSAALPASQEMMSLTFEKKTPTGAELHMRWDKLDEWVTIEAK